MEKGAAHVGKHALNKWPRDFETAARLKGRKDFDQRHKKSIRPVNLLAHAVASIPSFFLKRKARRLLIG